MKPHHILKSFNGSQTGNDFKEFKEGTTAALSTDLARIAVKEGWAKLVIEPTAKPHETAEEQPTEEKAIEAAPANKAIKAAPGKKAR